MTKQISYKVADTQISKRIVIYLDRVRTIYDLKNTIASDLKININNFDFKNPPTNEQIRDKSHYFILTVILKNFQRDIEFHLSKNTIITIKNANQMNFIDVIKEFERNNIYFSDDCVKHYMCLYSNDQRLNLRDDYPFLFISTFVIVKIIDKKVIMKYSSFRFYFTENDRINTAYGLINEVFWDSTNVVILDEQNKVISNFSEYLFADEKYHIELEYAAYFNSMDDPQYSDRLRFYCIPTVYDAKESIALYNSDEKYKVNPDNVFIFDRKKKMIHDMDRPLYSIQDLEKKFYYLIDPSYSQQVYEEERKRKRKTKNKNKNKKEKFSNSNQKSDNVKSGFYSSEKVKNLNNKQNQNYGFDGHESEGYLSLPIFFTFEEPNDKKYKEFIEFFQIKKTVDQIKQSICEKYKIKESISIKYKSSKKKNVISPHQTLEDIKDKIRETAKNGEIKYHLYVEIKFDEYDDDDDDDVNNNNAKKPSDDRAAAVVPEPSEKEKVQKKKIVKKPKPSFKPVEEEERKDVKEKPNEKERKRINKKTIKPSTKPVIYDSDDNSNENNDDDDIEKSRAKKMHDDDSENSNKKNQKPTKKSNKKIVDFDDSASYDADIPSESDDKAKKSVKELDENENKKPKTKKKPTKLFKPKINQIKEEDQKKQISENLDLKSTKTLEKFNLMQTQISKKTNN